ncbi:MAG: right-handed parallel beta-helix repeat-containing protein [Candidatus Poribacteria bacterium]|nr:right-handed parallel beta-helix repeat-containing protein [Candidatus Poribacteria bacterium]
MKNLEAIAEVKSGKRTDANASWWGFDPEDATEGLQAAIDSGARRLIVPNMRADWIVRPIKLASNQEIIFERGTVVSAKRGEYRGKGDSLFTAQDVENLTIRGYGATFRMWKQDYITGLVLEQFDWHRWYGQYPKAEWRMTLSIRGSKNVNVSGLTLKDSGGDGIYVDGGKSLRHSENVYLRDITCENHYRQGISVISAENLIVDNCTFSNTWGTPPSSGVDIEPDLADQRIKNVKFSGCQFVDNAGDGIEIFLAHITDETEDVTIRFDNCYISSQHGAGIRVSKVRDNGPGGYIEFNNCTVENTKSYGIKVQEKSITGARVTFNDCAVINAATDRDFGGEWSPISLSLPQTNIVQAMGGIDFIDCFVEDNFERPAVAYTQQDSDLPLQDVTGTITVLNPTCVNSELGKDTDKLSLIVKAYGQNSTNLPFGFIKRQATYLYHGSKQLLPKLKKRQALAPPGRPPEEALEAIYLTPDFLFALACAARPPGTSKIDLTERTISFDKPDQFQPDEPIYIYYVDSTKISEDKKIYIDPYQVAVTEDEITPEKVETYQSSDLLKHYRVIDNWDDSEQDKSG